LEYLINRVLHRFPQSGKVKSNYRRSRLGDQTDKTVSPAYGLGEWEAQRLHRQNEEEAGQRLLMGVTLDSFSKQTP
ncbi:hypothetical protein, partial [Serratia symbiotica]|uniref:hypothetical protein n=1 Tax=Serratia symbiotica TaxID=138074 RepID=UPI00055B5521